MNRKQLYLKLLTVLLCTSLLLACSTNAKSQIDLVTEQLSSNAAGVENIRTRRYDLRLENGDRGEPLLTKDQWLMEIKAENSIPLWLSKLLSEYKLYKTSFSKYGLEHQKMVLKNQKLNGERKPCLKQYSIQHQLMPQYL